MARLNAAPGRRTDLPPRGPGLPASGFLFPPRPRGSHCLLQAGRCHCAPAPGPRALKTSPAVAPGFQHPSKYQASEHRCGPEGGRARAGRHSQRQNVPGRPPRARGTSRAEGQGPPGENQRLLPSERGPAGQVQQPRLVSGLQDQGAWLHVQDQQPGLWGPIPHCARDAAFGMYRNNTFNVGMESSFVTGPDNHITPYDHLNFHPSYNTNKPSICD
ncbi:piercer of microtubule wall 1 protein isoform 1-T1 [Dugong dugon]